MKNYSVVSLWLFMSFTPCISTGQVAINTFTTVNTVTVSGGTSSQTVAAHSGSVNGVTPSADYSVSYNNSGNISITGFTYSSKSYVRYAYFDTIFVRRVANASETTNGNKQHIYCQGPPVVDNLGYTMPFPVAYPQVAGHNYMERAMKEGYINRGSDNVFNNDAASDLTFNNIERVDFVSRSGVASKNAASAGFLIAERGGNDAFKMAAILSVDVNGNPTNFGPVLSVSILSYGAPIATFASYVMRRDVADNTLRPFSMVPAQGVRSVFVRFSDLGVPNNYTIYGYALMANDVTATTSAQVLNYTNSTYFPLTTTSGSGGMDLASAPGVFHTDLVLSVHSLSLAAKQNNCTQELSWVDDEFSKVNEYQVEKATDGVNFQKAGIVRPNTSADFKFIDEKFTTSSFYRLKVVEKDGSYYYSSTVMAKCNCNNSTVSVYPNPAQDFVRIAFDKSTGGEQVMLVDASGKIFGNWLNNSNTTAMELEIKNLSSGIYFLRIKNKESQVNTYQFIKK